MTYSADKVLHQALSLSANERVVIVEKLLYSLDKPNVDIDEIWAKEVDARIEAYEKGEMETVSAEDVFAKYRRL